MTPRFAHGTHVLPDEITGVVCHRLRDKTEEYLVRWKSSTTNRLTAYSWHPLWELCGDLNGEHSCLPHVQEYVDQLRSKASRRNLSHNDDQPRNPQFARLQGAVSESVSRASSVPATGSESSLDLSIDEEARDNYNCKLVVNGLTIRIQDDDTYPIDTSGFPTDAMLFRASKSRVSEANHRIRNEYQRKLLDAAEGCAPLEIVNIEDESSPPMNFEFISDYRWGKDVIPPDPSTLEGCGGGKRPCRPDMGGDCGCEYTQDCECLEFAHPVNPEDQAIYARGESTKGLSKKFPYSKHEKLLVSFYLDTRYPIYECNEKCPCGPNCKTRVVQKGRQVGLQIFKTKNRGFGLRCMEDLRRGQFIDLYKGEVITVKEADRRRAKSGPGKESYFYALDKFPEACQRVNGQDALYEVDGEFMGGPTRFMNHSCQPNCRQFVVMTDKYNMYLYNLAFFAARDIPAYEELTFDYLDADDGDGEQGGEANDGEGIRCKCGAARCRGRLWI